MSALNMTMDELLAVVGSQYLEITVLRKQNTVLQQRVAELTKPDDTKVPKDVERNSNSGNVAQAA